MLKIVKKPLGIPYSIAVGNYPKEAWIVVLYPSGRGREIFYCSPSGMRGWKEPPMPKGELYKIARKEILQK